MNQKVKDPVPASSASSEALVHRLVVTLKRALSDLSKVEDKLDDLLQCVRAAGYPALPQFPEKTAGSSFEKGVPLAVLRVLEARTGAYRLEFRTINNSRVEVKIDKVTVKLPPRLAAVLRVLAANDADPHAPGSVSPISGMEVLSALAEGLNPIPDPFVRWKSIHELRQKLGKEAGREISVGSLTNLVYRLRQALRDQAGFHPDWVQRDTRYGLRFALRRPSAQQ